jgi:hypothetical protein
MEHRRRARHAFLLQAESCVLRISAFKNTCISHNNHVAGICFWEKLDTGEQGIGLKKVCAGESVDKAARAKDYIQPSSSCNAYGFQAGTLEGSPVPLALALLMAIRLAPLWVLLCH